MSPVVPRLTRIERTLRATYGQARHHNPDDPLDDLVFITLSRMTQEVKYLRTYRKLRARFPSWEQLLRAPHQSVRDLLLDAGLAETKARQLRELLSEILRREGKLSLDRLRGEQDGYVERYLSGLPGVGVKSARCVMLYALGRDVFPADTHVWRVFQRLGLGPAGAWTDRHAQDLQQIVPQGIRSSLHVTLVSHGRAVCLARNPRCQECVIAELCPSAQGFQTAVPAA